MSKAVFFAAFIAVSGQCFGEGLPVLTKPGCEMGVQMSRYGYEEPEIMTISGNKLGVTASCTEFSPKGYFVTLDGRIAYGALTYDGGAESGKLYHAPDSNLEARFVFGKDFPGNGGNPPVSPYAGLGYRYLFSNLSGNTTTGSFGYRRYSQYWYVPVGLRSRIKMNGFVFVPTVEYDWFLKGEQTSRLTDTGLWSRDAVNKQKHGYGYKISLMLERGAWSFGPWMHFWKIKKSEEVSIGSPTTAPGFEFVAWEPPNETKEFGVEARRHF